MRTLTTLSLRELPSLWLTTAVALGSAVLLMLCGPAQAATALVVQDAVALRAAAKDSAPVQAQLWRGEALEIRGERLDHFQVYDYRRERGGFVRKSQLLPLDGAAAEPAALLAALRLVRQQPGAESLGLGLAAAYVQAASVEQMNGGGGAEALEAMGQSAERLADRASRTQPRPDGGSTAAEAQLAAQLEVAARYGVRFRTLARDAGAMQLCYEGDAFRRLLGMPAASGEQKARAALALTRSDCVDPALTPPQREQFDQWRADVLDKVDLPPLPTHWRNRVLMRQASVWSSLAYQQARRAGASMGASRGTGAASNTVAGTGANSAMGTVSGSASGNGASDSGAVAARKALEQFARIVSVDLAEDDQAAFNEAAMRGNAMRWLAMGGVGLSDQTLGSLRLSLQPGQPGETCLTLTAVGGREALLRHCAWGLVMGASARINREGNAVAIASVPADGWRELWVLRKSAQGWRFSVLPPVAAQPGLGYAEFAGWLPGGQELLVAREARAEGRYRRSFEVVQLDGLETKRQAGDASMLGAFQRWQAADWKGATLSLR
ncbi:hypothetical protein [Roseateles amylovorans]|uniref:SH3 domain-containing protein n=1 Tax=Roseateles amylovorans TaxID=2978473 RepID=A0ABY6B369_9BURK|nr:hypothetical protein [Roseateles amylovorans]UXH77973.1 hypothetical protein N4261_23935 [Roseateles amylovorans]